MGKSGKRAVQKRTRTPKTLFETVVGVVKKSKKGVTVAVIKEKTGLSETQIRNAIYRARSQGIIKKQGTGDLYRRLTGPRSKSFGICLTPGARISNLAGRPT